MFCYYFCFCQFDVVVEGVDLMIGVGDVDIVYIDKGDCFDVGLCQCFCCSGVDFVDFDYVDVGVGKILQCFFII